MGSSSLRSRAVEPLPQGAEQPVHSDQSDIWHGELQSGGLHDFNCLELLLGQLSPWLGAFCK